MKVKLLLISSVFLASYGSAVANNDLTCSPEEIKAMITKENKIRRTTAPTYHEVVQATTNAKIAAGEDAGCTTILDEGFDLGSMTDKFKDLLGGLSMPSIGGMADSYKKGMQDSFCTYFSPSGFKKHVKKLAERGIKEYYGADIRDAKGVLREYGVRDINDSFADQVVNKQTRDGYKAVRGASTWEDPDDRTGKSVSRDVRDAIFKDPLDEAYDSTRR